jgi:hypothetical protein
MRGVMFQNILIEKLGPSAGLLVCKQMCCQVRCWVSLLW